MAGANHWLVAVTVPEWLNWIATASLRVSLNRVVCLSSESDQGNFDALMALSPQVTWSEDQAYVLARLRADFSAHATALPSSTRFDPVTLNLRAVESFVPVSNRCARLLEADGRRAAVIFGAPVYEPLWSVWVSRGLEHKRNSNGKAFTAAMGLEGSNLDKFALVAEPYLSNPSDLDPKVLELRGTRAFGWGVVIRLLRERIPEEAWKPIRVEFGTQRLVEDLKEKYDVKRPLHGDEWVISAMARMPVALAEWSQTNFSLLGLALTFHYVDLLRDGGSKFELGSLIADLVELLLAEGEQVAATVAYLVGKSAPDTMVTTLLYARSPEQYPCLLPNMPPCETDVPALARIEQQRRTASMAPSAEVSNTENHAGRECVEAPPENWIYDATLDQSSVANATTEPTVGSAEAQTTTQPALPTTPTQTGTEAAAESEAEQLSDPLQTTVTAEPVSTQGDPSTASQSALAFEDPTSTADEPAAAATKKRKEPRAKKNRSAPAPAGNDSAG